MAADRYLRQRHCCPETILVVDIENLLAVQQVEVVVLYYVSLFLNLHHMYLSSDQENSGVL